jgi:hypothetical protein
MDRWETLHLCVGCRFAGGYVHYITLHYNKSHYGRTHCSSSPRIRLELVTEQRFPADSATFRWLTRDLTSINDWATSAALLSAVYHGILCTWRHWGGYVYFWPICVSMELARTRLGSNYKGRTITDNILRTIYSCSSTSRMIRRERYIRWIQMCEFMHAMNGARIIGIIKSSIWSNYNLSRNYAWLIGPSFNRMRLFSSVQFSSGCPTRQTADLLSTATNC